MVALTVLTHNQNGNSHKAAKQWREDFVKCNILIQNAIVLPRVLMHLSFFHLNRRGRRFKSLELISKAAILQRCLLRQPIYHFFEGNFFGFYFTLLHLPPNRFNCVAGCWDRTQDSCHLGICFQML